MSNREFIQLVEDMRFEQREWFKTHEFKHLSNAKMLERKVDKAIEELKSEAKQLEINF